MDNVVTLNLDGRIIHILGTAHVLAQSKTEVRELIASVQPDTVCVELCDSRYQSLKNRDRWKGLDILKVIREGKGFLLFANMVLAAFQKRVGVDLESAPGEEMVAAFQTAESMGKTVVLADRDVTVTLNRAWRLSGFRDRMRILEVLLEILFEKDSVEKKDVQQLLEGRDMFNEVMTLFSEKLPQVKKVFLDERDEFIARKILDAPGKTVVAVVGKGHQEGIRARLENRTDYHPAIETVPPKKIGSKIFPWIVTAAVLALFGLGFLKGGRTGLDMLLTWVLVTGTTTAISALAVLSHPVTILASWLVAPLTTLNPLVGAGMFLSLIEAFFHKPRVRDFESLPDDMTTVKGFFKNRVTKILLVFVATSIGASVGTFVGIPWITALLGKK